MVRKADPAFLTFQEKIFVRDGYTCQFCGFRARQHMDVVNKDNNFRNNRVSNLITSCCFCSQNYFLESVGRDEIGGGSLVVIPEFKPHELNALCHNLFTAIVSGSAMATQARNIYRSLKLRSQKTEKLLGEGMSNPVLVGRLLVECEEQEVEKIRDRLEQGIRLLPDLQGFAVPVKTWIQTAVGEVEGF